MWGQARVPVGGCLMLGLLKLILATIKCQRHHQKVYRKEFYTFQFRRPGLKPFTKLQ